MLIRKTAKTSKEKAILKNSNTSLREMIRNSVHEHGFHKKCYSQALHKRRATIVAWQVRCHRKWASKLEDIGIIGQLEVGQWTHGEGQRPWLAERWGENLTPHGSPEPLDIKTSQASTNFVSHVLFRPAE